ncbi:Co-chaperone GrpE family protein [Forsythia ovata]|uniref:GrpE protein homolog n=1 Tax=Forsythia ovata TaxID=205694 RepID=A0ABD1R3G0_9LAMI
MVSTALKPAPAAYLNTTANNSALKPHSNFSCVSFGQKRLLKQFLSFRCTNSNRSNANFPRNLVKKFLLSASNGETAETQIETEEEGSVQESEPEFEGNLDAAVGVDSASENGDTVVEEPASAVIASLNLYREAVANNDVAKVADIESFLESVEDEKMELEMKVATLSEELSYEKDRILRVSADFDNFRKRTERERLSLVSNAQGEVVENLLPVLDSFERAKAQIKVETEGEEKINNSYQSIHKQFVEILGSIGVVKVETVGKPFDPMLHEAIMREDSTEFEDGIILEEYRNGFKLGDRLLRPSMVKVSAGPGPAKPKTEEASDEQEEVNKNRVEGSSEAGSGKE